MPKTCLDMVCPSRDRIRAAPRPSLIRRQRSRRRLAAQQAVTMDGCLLHTQSEALDTRSMHERIGSKQGESKGRTCRRSGTTAVHRVRFWIVPIAVKRSELYCRHKDL